jgi:uncharacterized protein YaeQ
MQKYTISITCNGQPRRLIMARASGESEQHLALKLLAYLLYFDREPTIELRVGQHYKPDLAIVDGRDVTLWVDCGDIGPHKLDRITTSNRNAEIIVVKPDRRSAHSFRAVTNRRIRQPARVRIVAFDDGFIGQFVSALSTRTDLNATTQTEPVRVRIAINGQMFESAVHRV